MNCVRLLDSPFKEAMEINRAYLLELASDLLDENLLELLTADIDRSQAEPVPLRPWPGMFCQMQ